MKYAASFLVFVVLFAVLKCDRLPTSEKEIESQIQHVIPKNLDISLYPDAQQELAEHLRNCGEGVVEGLPGNYPNRCGYHIRIDDLFLTPLNEKAGYRSDPQWALRSGARWMSASASEMAEVPEDWDLSQTGSMIRIFRQKCGDCWAQASRANLEQLVLTHTGINIPLATQTLISCSDSGSCSGGYMSAPAWVKKHGLPVETRDPYQGKNSRCKFDLSTEKMDYFLMDAPYVGNSLQHSRGLPDEKRENVKIKNIQALMMKYQSSAVVTIQAISQSGGIIHNCSAINSGGNHMQDIVGWYHEQNELIARLQNSWGTSHGQEGYTHIRWDCGEGKFNRGIGLNARVGVYRAPLRCTNIPLAETGPDRTLKTSTGVRIGKPARKGFQCSWVPKVGLSDPEVCNPIANPKIPTEYHLTVNTDCGESSAMVVVTPKSFARASSHPLLTPFGTVEWKPSP